MAFPRSVGNAELGGGVVAAARTHLALSLLVELEERLISGSDGTQGLEVE